MKKSRVENNRLVVGIDASRNRSGGAKAHLLGILNNAEPWLQDIKEVHVWAYKSLQKQLPDYPWLIKHTPSELDKSIVHQLFWQRFKFKHELIRENCSIVLNTDAGTIGKFHPSVTMSRDMLSYEPGEIKRYGLSKARIRLILLKFIQNSSLKHSDGAIFLTRYAGRIIQESCGRLNNVCYIPHGIGENFKDIVVEKKWPENMQRSIECLYISNTAMYKHQWKVVKAVENLRQQGYDVVLKLVGGGSGRAQKLLMKQIEQSDPEGKYVKQIEFVPQKDLPGYLSNSDIFVFASSCENMPNTLVEAMATGLPIACSDRGPMPEVLNDGGLYFNPEDPDTITDALKKIIDNPELRKNISEQAKYNSNQYSWARCARETYSFLVETHNKSNQND